MEGVGTTTELLFIRKSYIRMLLIIEAALGAVAAFIQISYFINDLRRKGNEKNTSSPYLWCIATLIILFLLGKTVYQDYLLDKKDAVIEYKNNIAKQAYLILQESTGDDASDTVKYMAFLEAHKDVYPDTYKRMSDLVDKMDVRYSFYQASDDLIPALYVRKMVEGAVKGIAAINPIE